MKKFHWTERRIKYENKNKVMPSISFLLILLLVSFNWFAQEENHKLEHHRHLKYANMKNPIAMMEQSIFAGRLIYEKKLHGLPWGIGQR